MIKSRVSTVILLQEVSDIDLYTRFLILRLAMSLESIRQSFLNLVKAQDGELNSEGTVKARETYFLREGIAIQAKQYGHLYLSYNSLNPQTFTGYSFDWRRGSI